MSTPIRAAGGVAWREAGNGVEVAVVHRSRYDDWSLPKGKLEAGESELAAAVREVGEETGARVAVTRRLIHVGYDYRGTPKTVAFWAMRFVCGEFTAGTEVDEMAWLPLDSARSRLSYGTDRSVLDAFATLPPPDAVVILVRHAKAGKRTQWQGDDRIRPLDRGGRTQARALVPFLAMFAPTRLLSPGLLRCEQTLEPLAKLLRADVEFAPRFADERYLDDPAATLAELDSFATSGAVTVICSQGLTIPGIVGQLPLPVPPDPATRKGASWVLCFVAGKISSADHYAPAPARSSR